MSAEQHQWVRVALRELGDRVRVARIHEGLTQERLAELADVHRSTVQRIEGGLADPKSSQILRIARVLRLPAGRLYP